MTTSRTVSSRSWRRSKHQGTTRGTKGPPTAVRQNLQHFDNAPHKYTLILSGDQLYRMNFRHLIVEHIRSGADVTVATIPVRRTDAGSFGILETDEYKRITRFEEKPKDPALLNELKIKGALLDELTNPTGEDLYLASMGIYVFNRDVLHKALSGRQVDFGKHIIPNLIPSGKLYSYAYQGYWEDIGTIKAFFDANLDLAHEMPQFNFFDTAAPIYTHARYLPASKIVRGRLSRAVISDGCVIVDAQIDHAVIGIRSRIEAGTQLTGLHRDGSRRLRDSAGN